MAEWLLEYQAEGIEDRIQPHIETLKQRLATETKEKEKLRIQEEIDIWTNFSLDKKS